MNIPLSDDGLAQLRAVWPTPPVMDLLEAALATDARAAASFAHWQTIQTLDRTSWTEDRLLAASARRIKTLDPAYPFHGRVQGFRRFIFTHSHRMLHATRPMLLGLSEAGIEFMLLKGAVRLALAPGLAADRFASDVDILIHIEDWDRTMQLARDNGWWQVPKPRTAHLSSFEAQYPYEHSIDFRSAGAESAGRLDVHHHARHMVRNTGDDDAIWAHATNAEFLGIPVRIPSPTDQLLISLAHAFGYASKKTPPAADWALDAALVLNEGGVDWQRLVHDAHQSRTAAFVGSALLLMTERLEMAVPPAVVDQLIALIRPSMLGELRYVRGGFYGSLQKSRHLTAETLKVAVARATLAARRSWHNPKRPRGRLELPAASHIAQLEPGRPACIPLPTHLRPGDGLGVDISYTVTIETLPATVTAESPLAILAAWRHPVETTSGSRQIQHRLELSPELFVMGKARTLDIRVRGTAPITDLVVTWRGEAPLRALRRKLGNLKRRVSKRLTMLASS